MKKTIEVARAIIAVLLGYAAAFGAFYLLLLLYFEELMYITDSVLTLFVIAFVGVFGSGVMVSCGFLTLTRKREKKLVRDLKTVVDGVSAGDFSAKISPTKDGELNKVVAKLNSLVEKLGGVAGEKYDFINNFMHEFRTPITSVKGFSEMLATENSLTDEETDKYCKIIRKECERLSELSETTAFLYNSDERFDNTKKQTFDIKDEVEECVLQFLNEAKCKNITITADIESFTVSAFKNLSRELWLNLISNSIKYTDNGGKVRISGKHFAGGYKLEVSDNGEGISEQALGRIFTAYYRENPVRDCGGAGLGLAIAKRVADVHGWKLQVKSEKGKGSTFEVIIDEKK